MHAINNIFETTGKREMILRFCKASVEEFYAKKEMPDSYKNGIKSLENAILPPTYISKRHIIEALRSFTICEVCSDIYGKIFSKIGKVICFYLLKNKQAMQSEVESITLTPIPQKLNMKGVLQQAGKTALVAAGTATAFFNKTIGIPMAAVGIRLNTEDAMIDDPEIRDIISIIRGIDFSLLYEINSN